MKKLGLVVQRYGEEVNGGAEYHARVLAEQLVAHFNVTVLTSCAINYHDWKPVFQPGVSNLNGITIHRFATQTKNQKKFRAFRRIISVDTKLIRVLKRLKLFAFLQKFIDFSPTSQDCQQWLIEQGPYCPDLIDFLAKNKDNFDCFLFFTYLYYPTAVGMPQVAEKSFFIPTAHDEHIMFTKPYENIFDIPKGIIYNTQSEKQLVEKYFKNAKKNAIVAGVGIKKFEINHSLVDADKLLNKPYFIYIGRIDGTKGCDILIRYFSNFLKTQQSDVQLLMVGHNHLPKTKHHENIHYTGFVNEDTKYQLLENSLGLIIPSLYESLSMVTLEAMLHKKIVFANKHCEVLADHIMNSKSGYLFDTQESFNLALLDYMHQNDADKEALLTRAENYVKEHYNWPVIISKIKHFIDEE